MLRQLDAVQVALLAVALDGRHRLRVVEGALESQVVDLGQQELVEGDPGVLGHNWTHCINEFFKFLNIGQPRPLFHLFLSFRTENFSSQQDSNSDRQSRRQER